MLFRPSVFGVICVDIIRPMDGNKGLLAGLRDGYFNQKHAWGFYRPTSLFTEVEEEMRCEDHLIMNQRKQG